jgi:hypothetical protein
MNETTGLTSWFLLGGFCLSPIFIFGLGFALGRGVKGWRLRSPLERVEELEDEGEGYYVEAQ